MSSVYLSRYALTAALVAVPLTANAASYVRFDTVLGSFDLKLYETLKPGHVENFLAYTTAGDYNDSIVHRSQAGFVIQGGLATDDGSTTNNPDSYPTIPTRGNITNEPGLTNKRGTIALARQAGAANSGSSQWFINVDDNTFLDSVDGGFSVFGEVLGDGMDIVDAINALSTFNFGGAFGQMPLRDYAVGESIDSDNLVVVNTVTFLGNSLPLDPEPTDPTTPTEPGNGDGNGEDGDNGNGDGGDNGGAPNPIPTPSAAIAGLALLGGLTLRRRSA